MLAPFILVLGFAVTCFAGRDCYKAVTKKESI